MKKICVSILLTIILISSFGHAFSRNITGTWKDPQNTVWYIGQIKSAATFIFSIDSDKTGYVRIEFAGTIRDGINQNAFSFSAPGTEFSYFENKQMCTVQPTISTNGQVIGQFGGRRIIMTNCIVTAHVVCNKTIKESRYNCSGPWR